MCQAYDAEHRFFSGLVRRFHALHGYGRCACGHYVSDHNVIYGTCELCGYTVPKRGYPREYRCTLETPL